MELDPAPWIAALRRSQDDLAALVGRRDVDQLQANSYCTDWTVAQVLSHLGSGAEIFGLVIDAGLEGTDPPGREQFGPIWEAWNSRDPSEQANDCLSANEAFVSRLEGFDEEQHEAFEVSLFGMELGSARLAGMRLGEVALHSWDLVALEDDGAQVADYAVELLIDVVDQMAARIGKSDGEERRIEVVTTEPARRFVLVTGENVSLNQDSAEADAASVDPEESDRLELPAESLIRLVYGRLDPAHTPAYEADGVDLDVLRSIFPGI
jgi:uncharacterized protein (TIGR03083 family)